MASEVFDILAPELLSYDVLGSRGCTISSRCNLLVDIKFLQFDETSVSLTMDQYSPEGFGFDQFFKDSLCIPGDELLNTNQVLVWDVQTAMPQFHQKVWIFSVWEDTAGNFHFDEQSTWQVVGKTSCHQRSLHVLEFFGGGMGGWKAAGSFLEQFFQQRWETIAIENQLEVAMCYAISHETGLLTDLTGLPRTFFSEYHSSWVVCKDIRDKSWQPFVAEWGVDAILLSPPCQPWSGAATSPGVERLDGKLTAIGLLQCRWFRPHYIALEQVVGFQTHPHKPVVLRILHWLGYRIVFEKVVDLADQSPSHRQRFLLVAVRVHSNVTTAPLKGWFRQEFNKQPLRCCIRLPADMISQLQPTEDTKSLASNPEFSKGLGRLTPEKVLASRITHDGQCAPTFMAKYGSQHEFDISYLKKHGYFGHFVAMQDDTNSFRFWHPAEIAIIHGIVHSTFLPQELKLAWHIVGNQICLPHALLLVADMFYRLHHFDYSPFVVFSQFQALRFQGPQAVLMPCPGGFLIGNCEGTTISPHLSELVNCVENSVEFRCWHPKCGTGLTALARARDDNAHTGVLEETVSNGSISPTEHFSISVLAKFEGDHSFAFWCDSNIPCKSIETLWFDHVNCTLVASSNPAQPCIRVVPARQQNSPTDDAWDIVTVYVEGELTLWSITPEQPLMYHDKLQTMQTTLYDQFGIVAPSQKNRFDIVILTKPLEFAIPNVSVLYLFAAFRDATIEIHWDASNHSNILAIDCATPGLSLLLDFWTSLFAQPQLESLGFRCFIDSDAGCIRFMPIPTIGVIPPAAFQLALGIAAVRSIFALIPVTWPIRARLTWFSRPLWSGLLSSDCTAQMIVNVIRMGLGTTKAISSFSLVHSGRRVPLDTVVNTLLKPDQEELVLHVVPELRGGGPSKQQQKLLAKNSIAAVLLENGHEIGWVKQTVESLHDQFGIPKLQQILVGPTQGQKLKDIKLACSELGISFPTPAKPTNQANALGPLKPKRRKENELSINPAEYKVDAGFFLTSDHKPAAQVNQLRANATGFCLVLPSDATPWLRANQTISADELGAIVLGKMPVETSLLTEAVTMPCTDQSGQSVLLSGTLIQLGSKALTYAKGDPKQVDAVAGHLMSITLYKDDWSPDRWMEATMNPISFVAKTLEHENLKECVQAMWGRSLRAGRAQASPAQATTVQLHCTVVDTKKEQLLRASGLNSLFFTPKTRAGRIDLAFKIVWIEGDLAQAIGLATQTPHCLGLVRGRSSYGLRFEEERFVEAWAKIHPGITPPPRSIGGLTFKIEELPFGCTCDMLTSWGSKISWKIVPFKALGPSTWLVRSEQQVPPGLLHFNTTPVLVRLLPARDVDKTPLLVGPRPKFQSQPRDMPPMLSSDPWANYNGPRVQSVATTQAPPRTLEGPVASKLKEQDEKIATLQSDLKKMAQQNDKQFAVMDKRMDSSDKQHAAQFGKMEASISSLSSSIDQALQSSVQQNANLMEKKMNELKALFQTKRLRDDKGQDEPME